MDRKAACACGALSIRVAGEPGLVAACSCLQCQKRTGSVFGVGAYYPNEQVLEKNGPSQSYERASDAGTRVNEHFCPTCGSTVFWDPEFLPGLTGIAVGCFETADFPAPVYAAWNATKHPWVNFPQQCQLSDAQDFE